jgi:hypothetical protein
VERPGFKRATRLNADSPQAVSGGKRADYETASGEKRFAFYFGLRMNQPRDSIGPPANSFKIDLKNFI